MPSKQQAKHSQDPFLMKQLQRAWVFRTYQRGEASPSSRFWPLQEAKGRWTEKALSRVQCVSESRNPAGKEQLLRKLSMRSEECLLGTKSSGPRYCYVFIKKGVGSKISIMTSPVNQLTLSSRYVSGTVKRFECIILCNLPNNIQGRSTVRILQMRKTEA